MPKRLHLSSDAGDWTVEVSGARVSITPDEGAPAEAVSVQVRPSDGDLTIDGLAGVGSGAAAVAGADVWVTVRGEVFVFAVTHGSHRTRETRDHDAFTPPMSATVVRVAVKPGDQVRDGEVLIALEAMKMELPIRSPRDGVVRAIHCREGELVNPGQQLIELE